MTEATIRAQVELQYALDRMSTPLHASRLSDATAAEDARCIAIIRAEIDRLTRERDEAREESEAVRFANVEGKMWVDNAVHDIRRLSSAIRWALGYDEGDPQFGEQAEQKGAFAWRAELRRRAGDALAQIEQERSEQAREG